MTYNQLKQLQEILKAMNAFREDLWSVNAARYAIKPHTQQNWKRILDDELIAPLLALVTAIENPAPITHERKPKSEPAKESPKAPVDPVKAQEPAVESPAVPEASKALEPPSVDAPKPSKVTGGKGKSNQGKAQLKPELIEPAAQEVGK